MSSRSKVVWSDGLFVKPHHFQQSQRHQEYYSLRMTSGYEPHNFGFTSLVLNEELLTLGKIALVSAKGIMPDGSIFSVPDEDMLPNTLEISGGFKANEIVYLCLPFSTEGGLEVQESGVSGVVARYRAETEAVRDNSVVGGELTSVDIAKAQPQLRLGSEDLSALTKLAVARITEKGNDGVIRLDTRFFPTMLSINSAPELRRFLGEMAEGIEQRAEQIAGRIGQPDQNGVADVSDFLMLQAMNRNGPVLRHFGQLPAMHPRELYANFIAIIGELATFLDERKRPAELPAYNHELPVNCWPQLMNRMRQYLTATLAANAVPISLERKMHGYILAPIRERELIKNNEFILAVKAKTPIERIQREFTSQAKVSSIEMIRDLVQKQLPGIPLRLMAVAPRQLPYHAGYNYFQLDQNTPEWNAMKSSKGFAFHIAGNFPELELQFWAIKS